MTLKEYIGENPSDLGAAAILNICTAWFHRLAPALVISDKDCMAFVGALSQYFDMDMSEEVMKSAEFVADMFGRVNDGIDLVQ